jgi:hypothetical protein
MAFENLISINFTEDELNQIDQASMLIESILLPKVINLTPEQRQQYGRIAEQNKLFVNKAKDYMEMYPQHLPPFVDKAEFDSDYTARQAIETRLMRLAGITEKLSDTKVLLDHDNYHNAITFYRNIKFMASENVPGTTQIYEGMRQFFVPDTAGTSPSAPSE